MFDDLFPSGLGRPSIAPEVVAAGCHVRSAVEGGLRGRGRRGRVPPVDLTYWRQRLAVSVRPHRVFEVVRQLITETGAVRGRNRRALDSTVLDDAVAGKTR